MDTSGVLSLIFMAIALSLDAFSICLGLGMQQFRLKRILVIGLVIGGFHIFMPFLGILIGKIFATSLESYAEVVGGGILIIIGAQMFFGAFTEEKKLFIQPVGIGLIILALTVSFDSFSIGFSLGVSGVRTILTLIIFGITSAILAWMALLIGRRVQGFLGKYSELFGGSILFTFGLKILFS